MRVKSHCGCILIQIALKVVIELSEHVVQLVKRGLLEVWVLIDLFSVQLFDLLQDVQCQFGVLRIVQGHLLDLALESDVLVLAPFFTLRLFD